MSYSSAGLLALAATNGLHWRAEGKTKAAGWPWLFYTCFLLCGFISSVLHSEPFEKIQNHICAVRSSKLTRQCGQTHLQGLLVQVGCLGVTESFQKVKNIPAQAGARSLNHPTVRPLMLSSEVRFSAITLSA